MYSELKKIIEQAWENRELLSEEPVRQAVRQVVELVDKGQLRTAVCRSAQTMSPWRYSGRLASSLVEVVSAMR